MKWLITVVLLASSSVCQAQDGYTIPLEKLNSSLAIPSLAAHDGVLYVAYRSFDLLRFSNQLQVLAYDLKAHKELRHITISLPKVHGERAADGFAISEDGSVLAYAEVYQPCIVVLMSTRDLSEIGRSAVLPFSAEDHQRILAGFDGNQLGFAANFYKYANPEVNGLHFLRIKTPSLKVSSDKKAAGLTQDTSTAIIWSPKSRITWLQSSSSGEWQEYTEDGQKTGAKFGSQAKYRVSHGATLTSDSTLFAYFGNLSDAGSVVSYRDNRASEVSLPCVPQPYSSGDVAEYAGAICRTSTDREPENGGNKILSSEFLLLKADGPTEVWRHSMNFLVVADSNERDTGIQRGDPLLYREGSKLLIVAPSKSPALTVYEVPLPNESSVASVSK
jgi:hypothetical protein